MTIEMFFNGGPATWLVAMLCAASVPAAAMQLHFSERTRFPGLNVGLGAMLGAAAVGGALLGQTMMMEAVASAEAESKVLLLMMGTGISVIPTVFGALAAVALTPFFALVHRAATPEVRPARAVPYVAVASVMLLGVAMAAEASWAHSLFTSLPFTDRADPAGIDAAVGALRIGVGASVGALVLGAANVVMGLIGGLRGLYRS